MSTLQTAIALSLLVFMVHGLRLVLTHASLGIEDWVVEATARILVGEEIKTNLNKP